MLEKVSTVSMGPTPYWVPLSTTYWPPISAGWYEVVPYPWPRSIISTGWSIVSTTPKEDGTGTVIVGRSITGPTEPVTAVVPYSLPRSISSRVYSSGDDASTSGISAPSSASCFTFTPLAALAA